MDQRTRRMSAAVTVLAVAWGVRRAKAETWVCDDAFISFRYARHLVEGHGLVFNVGEPVEGYTNFLWTLLVAAGMALGLDPVATAAALGIAAYAALIGLLGFRRVDGWPLAALACGLHLHLQRFATSGLETMLFTLLVTATVLQAARARDRQGWMLVGLLGALATLTRPEGAAVLLLAALAGRRQGGWALAVGAAIGVPYAAWKLWWFGDLLPNTWYAKGGADWSHGLLYLRLYGQAYWPVFVGFFAACVLAWRTRERLPLLIVAVCGLLLLHVARVGDFMFARFALPFTPLLLVALEDALPRKYGALWTALVGVAIVLSPYPQDLRARPGDAGGIEGILEEKDWYPPEWVGEAERQGAIIAARTEGLDLHAAYYGTQAMLVYHARVRALEAHVGLTDREVARLPVPEGARAGHGQKTDPAYLRSRGVDVVFDYRLAQQANRFEAVDFGEGVTGKLLCWRGEVLIPLSQRGVEVFDLPGFLDGYIAAMGDFPDEKVANDFAWLDGFYFQHNDDEARRAAFLERLP